MPALVAEARDIFPIMAKSTLANQERLCSHKEEEEVRVKNGTEGQQKAKEDMLGAVAASEYSSPPPFNIRPQGSPATFGSIDDAPVPISSSLTSAPVQNPAEGILFFGTVAVHNGRSNSAKSAVTRQPPPLADPSTSSSQAAPAATSTPSPKLFSGPSTEFVPTTQLHAISPIHHPPHPPASQPHPSVTSPPSTPPAANRSAPLSANAGAFVPAKKISIKNASGQEVTLDTLKRVPPPTIPPHPPSPASVKKDIKWQPIRIESQEQKEKRLAEESAKEWESEDKTESSDALVGANEAAARREIEEQGRHEAEERKAKEEAERAEKERKEAEGRALLEKERREAEERVAREVRDKEEERMQEARAQREAEEKAEKERAEQERLRKLLEEEEVRAKEEAERQRKAEEDKIKAVEASENAHSLPNDAAAESSSSLPEEEVEVEVSQAATTTAGEPASANKSPAAPRPPPSTPPSPHIPAELSVKPVEEPLRIDSSLPPSPEPPLEHSGSLDFQTTTSTDIAPCLPSALATARPIEDINRITYPQGIKKPELELNVNTQEGKFLYVFKEHVIAPWFLNMFPSQL